MKLEEHKAKLDEVLANLNDQGKVSTLLAELTEDYTKVSAEFETTKTTLDKINGDNEKLRQANMDLFLKVGDIKKDDKTNINNTVDNTPKFEDLFDEQGNLK